MKKEYIGPNSVRLPEMEENHQLCLRPVHISDFRLILMGSFLQLKNKKFKLLCGKQPVGIRKAGSLFSLLDDSRIKWQEV